MKIALTGSSGRIGQGVMSRAIDQGHDLVLIDRVQPPPHQAKSLPFVHLEMSDYEGIVRAFEGCDAVIHLAAIPSPGRDPDHIIHNNNVVGSYNVLRAAAEQGIRRVCQASSVNAIGHAFSRKPRYDYFPIDELHPNYSEDPYSLSKWILEEQGKAFARRYEHMIIASMRFHLTVPNRQMAIDQYNNRADVDKHLWAWTRLDAAADACLRSLQASFRGHEAFHIVSPTTTSEVPSLTLAASHFPDVPIIGDMSGTGSFFNSSKAERLLGWHHDPK